MKSSKKSVAGPVGSPSLLDGESEMVNKGSSARTAVFYLPGTLLICENRTVLSDSGSGF